jgi:hypothetical protein
MMAGVGRQNMNRIFVGDQLETGACPRLCAGREISGETSHIFCRWAAHLNSVAGNEAMVLDGATRYPGINFYGLNPGLVKTDIRSTFLGKGSLKHRLVEGVIGLLWGGPDEYAEKTAPLLVSISDRTILRCHVQQAIRAGASQLVTGAPTASAPPAMTGKIFKQAVSLYRAGPHRSFTNAKTLLKYSKKVNDTE